MHPLIKNYWSILLVLAVRVVFILTFSPNVGGDSLAYFNMLQTGGSNLILAPGAPFLMGLPLRLLFDETTLTQNPSAVLYVTVTLQHLVHLGAILLLHRLVTAVYSAPIAHATTLIYGLHWGAMSATSQINPEWLQASFLMAIAYLLYRGYQMPDWRGRFLRFAAAGFAFGWVFLVKYNSLYFVLLIVAAILFARSLAWRRKLQAAVAAATLAAVVVAGFKVFIHKPHTGTYTLSHDKAWLLLFKSAYFCYLMPENGPNTKRLLLLNSLLPWDNQNIFAFDSINYVSPDIEKYRAKYGYILTADDRVLDDLLARTERPKNFLFFTAFSPTTYYLGVAEGDALGVEVFKECVRAYPDRYAKNIGEQLWASLWTLQTYEPFPLRVDRRFTPVGRGYYKLDEATLKRNGTDPFSNPGGYYVWKPAVRAFRWLREPYVAFPNGLITITCFFGFLIVAVRRKGAAEWMYLLLSVLMLGFMVLSNALLEFRWYKELVAVMPLMTLMFVVSLFRIGDLVVRPLRSAVAARPPQLRARPDMAAGAAVGDAAATRLVAQLENVQSAIDAQSKALANLEARVERLEGEGPVARPHQPDRT